MIAIFFVALFAAAKGAGVLNAAEQYIELALAAYPERAEEIMALAEELANPLDYPSDYTPGDDEEFDFIVVGSGSAGNVVVNRLTEVEDWKVLLIEAGGDPIKSMEVPALFSTYINNTEIDWSYKTKPDGESCLGMKDQSCTWPRGKVLGGTSSFIFTVYERGNRRDYDQWEAEGCTGWGYENVLNYFKKSEDMRSPEVLAYSPEYHSTGGYLGVEEYATFAHEAFYEGVRKGMREVGYEPLPDLNGANQTGYNKIQGTLLDGRRGSSAKVFLSPIRSRSNLKVTKGSLATKVLVDQNKRAYGIEFFKDGATKTVRATKEIVLSAGTINSAQLLMLSGIGPKKHLESLNIDVVADLPVGENLQDHPYLNSIAYTTNHSDIAVTAEETMYNFLKKQPNVFSHINSLANIGFVTLTDNPDWPNCELVTFSFPKNSSAALNSLYTEVVGLNPELQQQIRDLNENSFISIPCCSYLRPYGRGKIELNSSDPFDYPILTTGYFSDERDIDIMLGYYDFVENFINTDGMRSLDAKMYELRVPACEEYTYKSRDYRLCVLRHFTLSTFHQAGSCKMGAPEDPSAVVDPSLRVKGVTGLRVIDASIMPTIVSSNINAPTMMIGEKGSDLIKESWLNKKNIVIDASIMPTIVSSNINAPTMMIGEKGSDLIKESWLNKKNIVMDASTIPTTVSSSINAPTTMIGEKASDLKSLISRTLG